MNHKWEDNKCVHCGVKRQRRSWKLLMAITNHPPYDHYKYGTNWYYTCTQDSWGGFDRPDCKNPTQQLLKP